MTNANHPRHALIGYSTKEYAAYRQWLNAISAGYINPDNKVRAVAAAEKNLRGLGKHVKEDS